MPENPMILLIDDSPTIRKMVECHLSQAGYRVALAPDAEKGVAMASTFNPDLILLDHQLPGTTGAEVCRLLLASEQTAQIPVLISSSLRNRAFAQYAEFPNVIDQIPKPYTPELLKSGVANALQTGSLVVQAQLTGCAIPEAVNEEPNAALTGDTGVIPVRAVLDFLNNLQLDGRLTVEMGKDRLRYAISGGRIQAAYSSTVHPDRVAPFLPAEINDLAPLLTVTLGEHQDASMSGLVRLLEKSLTDPRRLRTLLRSQAAVLVHLALTGESGLFGFESRMPLPPMFQAFPLQLSLPALAVEGVRRCVPPDELNGLGSLIFARTNPRGGNVDRVGLTPGDIRVHTLMEGTETLESIAHKANVPLNEVCVIARGLELIGQAERRKPTTTTVSVLLIEDDPDNARVALSVMGEEGEGLQVRHVRDRVAAQLLLRRQSFSLVMLPVDTPAQESFYLAIKEHAPNTTRFIGLISREASNDLERLDRLGLDGVIHRPITEADVQATLHQLLQTETLAEVS